jgi:hypothetical protein
MAKREPIKFERAGTTMEIVKKQFPKLAVDKDLAWSNLEGFVAFNSPTHVLGRTFPWIEPDPEHKGLVNDKEHGLLTFWPDVLPADSSLQNYIEMFKLFGFRECFHPTFDPEWTKILIYADKNEFKSVSLIRPYGLCTTKLGSGPIITHHPESLTSGPYGSIVMCMMRPAKRNHREDLEVINKYGGELARQIFKTSKLAY